MNKDNLISISDIQIKYLEEEQLNRLIPIYKDSFKGMTDDNIINQWLLTNIRAYPRMMCFGAWYHESLIGYALWAEKGAFRSEAIIELEQIAVLRRYRNQGIGTKLIQDSLELVKDSLKRRNAELKLVEVTTGVDNPAGKLYEKVLGAKQECLIKDYYDGDERIMRARSSPISNMAPEKKELLKLEYQECQTGYNNRDKLVPQELSYIVVLFGGLITVIGLLVTKFYNIDAFILRLIISIIGACGFIGLLGLLIDLESSASCKRALRKRSEDIEELLSPSKNQCSNIISHIPKWRKLVALLKRSKRYQSSDSTDDIPPLCIWRNVIPTREKYKLERLMKIRKTNYFVMAGTFLLVLWIVIVSIIAVYAPRYSPPDQDTSQPSSQLYLHDTIRIHELFSQN